MLFDADDDDDDDADIPNTASFSPQQRTSFSGHGSTTTDTGLEVGIFYRTVTLFATFLISSRIGQDGSRIRFQALGAGVVTLRYRECTKRLAFKKDTYSHLRLDIVWCLV